MCGLSGVLHHDGRPVDRRVLEEMSDCLRHRGPDDTGLYVEHGLGLSQTRLSIIDLSDRGHQPMASPDGRHVITYNGEVYNFQEIGERLRSHGHRFRGDSDTEVVLHAYMEWGAEAFEILEGMFSMAIWDRDLRSLTLVRDRFGIKPLYYSADPDRVVFGSEIKAILASGEVSALLSWQGLGEYMHYGTTLGSTTMFDGVRKLLPGYYMVVGQSRSRLVRYASVIDVEYVHDDLSTATERVRALVERAVKTHLVSDVPVGVFLSGGIDSSAIATFASKHYEGRLQTFTAGFDFDGGVNELSQARDLAQRLGADHHELHIHGSDLPDTIEKLVGCHDEPFGDAANIPLYLLTEQLHGEPKVILQGDGGDEIFGGYTKYLVQAHNSLFESVGRLAPIVLPFLPQRSSLARRLGWLRLLYGLEPSVQLAVHMSLEAHLDPPQSAFSIDARERLANTDPFVRYRELYVAVQERDPLQRSLHTDASILLPDLYFEKVDKATMAHSIEVRVPMVDTRLAAYVMGLPSRYKVKGWNKKYILRRALRGVVPDTILDRPKVGFGVPMGHWLRTSLSDFLWSVLAGTTARSAGLLDPEATERLIAEHVSGSRDHGKLLYRLLNLLLWCEKYQVAA